MADIKKTNNLAIGNLILDLVDDESRELIADVRSEVKGDISTFNSRVDNLIATYTANGGTKRTETVLFESETPSQGNVPSEGGYFDVEGSIDDYDYIEIHSSAFKKGGMIRIQPSDVPVAGTSATPVIWSIYEDPTNSSQVVHAVKFKLWKFDDLDRLSMSFQAWYRLADTNYTAVEMKSEWNVGLLKVVGIKYETAGSMKDAELVDIRTGADGTVYGSAGAAVRNQVEYLINGNDSLLQFETMDFSKVDAQQFGINSIGKWTRSVNQKSYTQKIERIKKIRVTGNSNGSIIAFIRSFEPVSNINVDFSTKYAERITLEANETKDFFISGDMNYFYALLQTQGGEDKTPDVSFYHITDKTLNETNIPADAKATGNAIDLLKTSLLEEKTLNVNIENTVPYTISTGGKWVKSISNPTYGAWFRIPTSIKYIRITTNDDQGSIISFLKHYRSAEVIHNNVPDFSDHYDAPIAIDAKESQIFSVHPDMKYIFVTVKTTAGTDIRPSEIAFVSATVTIPETSRMARSINRQLKNIAQPCEAVADTLPVQSGEVYDEEFFDLGAKINGIMYSSVWRDGLDVYWNKTLETYYSAMANPASILYTDSYTPKGISNAHAIMGGVCSTFVSYLLNFEHHNTTSQLAKKLHPKNMNSLYEVESGDVLLKTGHIAIISQVFSDSDGIVQSVNISEQAAPVSRTFNVHMDMLEEFLDINGYTIMENTFGNPRTLKYDGFAEDIIFEYGNNTYVEVSEAGEMWFYIPSHPVFIYYKKDDATEFSKYTLSEAVTKNVNDTTVYDLSACFSGVGDYVLTTDENNKKTCFIKIIDTGTISVENGQLTLAGFENCTPKQYEMVTLKANDGSVVSTAGNPPEGYYCSWGDYTEIENSFPQTIESVPADGKYKLAIDYDTSIGYKRVFSNNIGV